MRKKYSHTNLKTLSKTKSKGVIDTFGGILTDASNLDFKKLFFFVIGIISKFVPTVKKYATTFFKYYDQFKACFSLKPVEKEELPKKEAHEIEMIKKFSGMSEIQKLNYCSKVQQDITNKKNLAYEQIKEPKNSNIFDEILSLASNKYSKLEKLKESQKHPFYCNILMVDFMGNNSNAEKKEFLNGCKYFRNIECKEWASGNKSKGVGEIFTIAGEYFSYAMSINTCFNLKIINLKEKLKETIWKELENVFKKIVVSEAFNSTMHFLTLGLWGGVKAGYHLIKLGKEVYDFYQEDDAIKKPYLLGGLVGEAAKILKSLISGRRRFKKMKK